MDQDRSVRSLSFLSGMTDSGKGGEDMLYSDHYPTGKLLRARSICVMDDSLHGAGDEIV